MQFASTVRFELVFLCLFRRRAGVAALARGGSYYHTSRVATKVVASRRRVLQSAGAAAKTRVVWCAIRAEFELKEHTTTTREPY